MLFTKTIRTSLRTVYLIHYVHMTADTIHQGHQVSLNFCSRHRFRWLSNSFKSWHNSKARLVWMRMLMKQKHCRMIIQIISAIHVRVGQWGPQMAESSDHIAYSESTVNVVPSITTVDLVIRHLKQQRNQIITKTTANKRIRRIYTGIYRSNWSCL